MNSGGNEEAKAHSVLAKDAIAVLGQMVQSLAHIAPAVGVVFTASLILGGAGSSAPLAVLLSCLAVLPSVYLHSKLQSRWSGAGGYFAILPPAFGRYTGTAAGLLDIFYEPIITAITIFGFLGFGLEPWLGRSLTFGETVALSQLVILGVFLLSGRKIHIISRILFAFGIGEVVLFFFLGISLVARSNINFESITVIFRPADFSFGAFGNATLFGVLMFIGFESGIPFSEETRNAPASYMKGVWLSTALTALMFLFSYFAIVAANQNGGPLSDISLTTMAALPSPYFDKVAPEILGSGGRPFLLFVIFISTVSCCLASFGAGARNLFAFGRLGVLPRQFAVTNRKTGTPSGGNNACYLLTVLIAFGLTFIGKPALAFEFSATLGGTVAVILYLLVAAAGVRNYKILCASAAERSFMLWLAVADAVLFAYIVFSTVRDCWAKEGILSSIPWLLLGAISVAVVWSSFLNRHRPHIVDKIVKR